jgi:hypothetical protein
MSLSYTRGPSEADYCWELAVRTGTFFCEMTTAQSLPRTPTDVIFAAVIALNAYSGGGAVSKDALRWYDSTAIYIVMSRVAYRLDITGLGLRRW